MTLDPETSLWHVQRVGNPAAALILGPCVADRPGQPVHVAGPDCLPFERALREAARAIRSHGSVRVLVDAAAVPVDLYAELLERLNTMGILVAIGDAGEAVGGDP